MRATLFAIALAVLATSASVAHSGEIGPSPLFRSILADDPLPGTTAAPPETVYIERTVTERVVTAPAAAGIPPVAKDRVAQNFLGGTLALGGAFGTVWGATHPLKRAELEYTAGGGYTITPYEDTNPLLYWGLGAAVLGVLILAIK